MSDKVETVTPDAFDWLKELNVATEASPATQEKMRTENYEQALKMFNECKEIADVLMTPAGQMLLDQLLNKTVMVPLMDFHAAIVYGAAPVASSDWAYFRAGQNSIYHYFLNCIEVAKAGPPKDDEQPEED